MAETELANGVTQKEDGTLVIDLAAADALWNSLDEMKKAEFTNMIFEPVLKNATQMRKALEEIIMCCQLPNSRYEAIEEIAREALPK